MPRPEKRRRLPQRGPAGNNFAPPPVTHGKREGAPPPTTRSCAITLHGPKSIGKARVTTRSPQRVKK
eukprot:2564432-Alexandrium_andersonii.AAC.1